MDTRACGLSPRARKASRGAGFESKMAIGSSANVCLRADTWHASGLLLGGLGRLLEVAQGARTCHQNAPRKVGPGSPSQIFWGGEGAQKGERFARWHLFFLGQFLGRFLGPLLGRASGGGAWATSVCSPWLVSSRIACGAWCAGCRPQVPQAESLCKARQSAS